MRDAASPCPAGNREGLGASSPTRGGPGRTKVHTHPQKPITRAFSDTHPSPLLAWAPKAGHKQLRAWGLGLELPQEEQDHPPVRR